LKLAASPTEADLLRVSRDFGRLLVAAVRSAPVVPEYMSQIAASLVAADAAHGGTYGDVLKSAFVRRGILSPQSAVGMAAFQPRGIAAMAIVPEATAERRQDLPYVALAAAEYGLGDQPLLVGAPSDPRRFGAAAAAFGVGIVAPSNSERAARAFVEDLLQRGHIDISKVAREGVSLLHPHVFKTHRLEADPNGGGLVLNRILFDCGFRTIC
jgi:hypothetical protein